MWVNLTFIHSFNVPIISVYIPDKDVSEDTENPHKDDLASTAFIDKLSVVGVMPNIGIINGITVLGNELFVVRGSMKEVEVFDSNTFDLVRKLTIPDSKRIYGIGSCSHFNCLYISDYELNKVHRYDLLDNVTTNWSLSGRCYRLSVTREFTVLTILHENRRIQEYTTNGALIREIRLDVSIETPLHCVQLSNGHFAVSHTGGSQHRVCIVDLHGHIIQSYGGATGSEVGFLNSPYYMAVDKHDRVLVADWFNHKVQVLSLVLTHVGDAAIPEHQLNLPHVIHLDETSQRLFIGESSNSGSLYVLKADQCDHK